MMDDSAVIITSLETHTGVGEASISRVSSRVGEVKASAEPHELGLLCFRDVSLACLEDAREDETARDKGIDHEDDLRIQHEALSAGRGV